MNPITNIKSRQRQREDEIRLGLSDAASYHHDFRHSAYIYAGQLSFKLTEGDLLAIFSEYGEVVDVNLIRDKQTNESRGFAFIAYEDQRSTNLAVDNLNGFTVAGRMMAVDHVKDYKRLVENPDAVHDKDAGAQQVNDSGDPQSHRQPASVTTRATGPSAGPSLADMLADAEQMADAGHWRQRDETTLRQSHGPSMDKRQRSASDHKPAKKHKEGKHRSERHKEKRKHRRSPR